MKILYAPTTITGAYKAFKNYIEFKGYDAELVPLDFLNIPDFTECLTDYDNNNRMVGTLSLFFVYSYLNAGESIENFKKDYEIVKDDLSYGVNFEKIYEKLHRIDQIISALNPSVYQWMFLRIFDDLEFFQLYFINGLKNRGIKVAVGKEKPFRNGYQEIFESAADSVFIGHGENFLDTFFSSDELPWYFEDTNYKPEFLTSFNSGMCNLERERELFTFSYHTLCPYKCKFCTQNKGNNLGLDQGALEEFTNQFIRVNQRENIKNNFCISSLPFYTSHEIEYFFGKVYDTLGADVKFNILHLTTPQFLDNRDLLVKFKGSMFYVGVEHFSDRILKLMKKPTTREQNLKLLLDKNIQNLGFGTIYNYFTETYDEFDDMMRILKMIGKRHFYSTNNFQYTPLNSDDPEQYGFEFVQPEIFNEYFGCNVILKYRNAHDPDLKILRKKNLKL